MSTRVKFLVVKGNKFVAARAAADRGIPFVFDRELRGETTGYTTVSERKLNEWFIESVEPPYKSGDLLFWTYAKER
ncbi:MAG: hypothetical protein QXT45_06180 [Candidatus Bilamarchaeaceae archaeon]